MSHSLTPRPSWREDLRERTAAGGNAAAKEDPLNLLHSALLHTHPCTVIRSRTIPAVGLDVLDRFSTFGTYIEGDQLGHSPGRSGRTPAGPSDSNQNLACN